MQKLNVTDYKGTELTQHCTNNFSILEIYVILIKINAILKINQVL